MQNIKNKVMVCGSNGLVGHHVVDLLNNHNYEIFAVARKNEKLFSDSVKFIESDFNEYNDFINVLNHIKPNCIINCAAFTNVDLSEKEQTLANNLNFHFVEVLANWSAKNSCHLIHISTDYIFDGIKGPYLENSLTSPLSFYGKSKLLGDESILKTKNLRFSIFRSLVIYGSHKIQTKLNFVTWVIKQLRENKQIKIVTDQISNFTYSIDLAKIITQAIHTHFGVYNIAGDRYLSRYDLAMLIADTLNYNKGLIQPILTKELNQMAKRPLNSGLSINKAIKHLKFKPTPLEITLLEIDKHLS